MSWLIQLEYTYGWDDADWHTDGIPLRFATREKAQAALDTYLAESYGLNPERADAYRIVEVTP